MCVITPEDIVLSHVLVYNQITPVAIVLYTTISLLNLHQRQSWAWAAIVHHVFLLTVCFLVDDIREYRIIDLQVLLDFF